MIGKSLILVALIAIGLFLTSMPMTNVKGDDFSSIQSGLTTLYAFDPIESSLCFQDGRGGYGIERNKVVNRCSHLAFDIYQKDSLTVGIQGGETGAIVDLGTAVDLKQKYGYEETVGNGQGFASLQATGDGIVILKNYKEQSYQSLSEAENLL